MVLSHSTNPLGKNTVYPSSYDKSLLFPIARSLARQSLNINTLESLQGFDIWTAFEISWLNAKGKPKVGLGEFWFDCKSEFIVESKSFKLYLNSFNQTRFNSTQELVALMQQDLSAVVVSPVKINLWSLDNCPLKTEEPEAFTCLDHLDVQIEDYHPNKNLLTLRNEDNQVKKRWVSHLLKTNCPVTGQPDWASLFIDYEGVELDEAGLLAYVISFREHQDFHEHCIEKIYCDLMEVFAPKKLTVFGRYTRRGGLDINPFRSNDENARPAVGRVLRQ